MLYQDMVLEAAQATLERTPEKQRIGHFTIRVIESPAGEMPPEQAIAVSYDDKQLQANIQALDSRTLDPAAMRAFGRDLAALLLPAAPAGAPTGIRELFAASLLKIGPDTGLRLRLRLPTQLAPLPWEFCYIERAGGGDGIDGFVALDPRVAFVRHEALAAAPTPPKVDGPIKVVAALASAAGFAPLDLAKERADLEAAFANQDEIAPTFIDDATLDEVQSAIVGASVFHFAGHGKFEQRMGATPGSFVGSGALAFDDIVVPAEQIGVNLRGAGIRLAVLGGCESGRRDGSNGWSGVAPDLVKAEIPAVVANQFTIRDDCAIAFSKHFYQSLVAGLPIEQAVSAGRIAAYNADTSGRDWGVPVLYLRAENGELFGGATEPAVRDQAAAAAKALFTVRTGNVAASGEVLGAQVSQISKGSLVVNVTTGVVAGTVTGSTIDTMNGGSADTTVETGDVAEGGKVTGGSISIL